MKVLFNSEGKKWSESELSIFRVTTENLDAPDVHVEFPGKNDKYVLAENFDQAIHFVREYYSVNDMVHVIGCENLGGVLFPTDEELEGND